jgi:hypothetical protein
MADFLARTMVGLALAVPLTICLVVISAMVALPIAWAVIFLRSLMGGNQ